MKKTSDEDEKFPERRLTRAETEIEALGLNLGALTKDVKDLASVVRQHGENIELQFRGLHVAITSAAGPRQTNWGTLISAALLTMAVGGASLSPLYLRMSDVQNSLAKSELKFETHEKLDLHPVGENRIDAMEDELRAASVRNAKGITELDVKLQKEYQLIDANVRERVNAVEREVSSRWVIDGTALQKIQDSVAANNVRLAVIEVELKRLDR